MTDTHELHAVAARLHEIEWGQLQVDNCTIFIKNTDMSTINFDFACDHEKLKFILRQIEGLGIEACLSILAEIKCFHEFRGLDEEEQTSKPITSLNIHEKAIEFCME